MTIETTAANDLRLNGDRVVLREFRDTDVEAVLALIGDSRVTEWLSFDTRNRQDAEAMLAGVAQRREVRPRTEFYMAITPGDESDQCVGFMRLALNGVKAGKLGYAVAFDHWGRGYATDAARTIIDYGFHTLDLHRISAAIGPDNSASIRMAERLGMTREGVIRDHVFTNGGWRDSVLYSILAPEWNAESAHTSGV